MTTATTPGRDRYRPQPSVLTALKSPRILTREVLAGLVVALALIPEAISFSIVAGVDPKVGLFSSFIMAVTIAFVGGRPAMITAATGAIALVIAPVAREYGMDYFIATVLLAGVLQITLAALGVAKLMRFIPRSVMVGFVNALAILIFMTQMPELIGVPWMVYPLLAVGLAILIIMPRVTKVIPAPLVSIVVVTAAVVILAINVPTVGDKGELPRSLPELFIPNVPLTWETLTIIGPFALAMALVGLSMLRRPGSEGDPAVRIDTGKALRLAPVGLATGLAAGFFGIGGGFLIVPGLMAATGMTLRHAAASSLVSVALFGAATSASYAWSGLVNWPLFLALIAGGALGALVGARLSSRLATRVTLARRLFAGMILATAAYVAWRSLWG